MLLPNRREAYVSREKLTSYLLSPTHAVGRFKARFFRACGYGYETVDRLEQDLLYVAHENDVAEVVESPHGTKYVIEGTLETPLGTTIRVRTVWVVEPGDKPRFVTAYPR